MGKNICVLIAFLFSISATAQLKDQVPAMRSLKSRETTICFSRPDDQGLIIPAPQAYQSWKLNKSAKTNATTFEVEYVGFPPEAEAAFQKAVDIWSSIIETNVPIRILAVWQVISSGGSTSNVLGGANPGTYIRDFDGAQKSLTWYPVALAEKMANREFNDITDPDIFAQFNSAFPNWYFGIDGIRQTGKTDLVTVVLHEIGHGLGITKGYDVNGTNGEISSFFAPLHVVYDHFIENASENNLMQNFVPPSSVLKTELTSGALWFRSPQLEKIVGGTDERAFLFSPNPFQGGSSIAHLDETFYNGSANALMTPQVGNAEVIHDPGPVVKKMLADMGWLHTRIEHTRLPNTENVSTPYEVTATFIADQKDLLDVAYGYNSNEVKLHYTTDGASFTTIAMTPTGTANEFSAEIPNAGAAVDYGYYISVKDNLNRIITKPGTYTEDGEAPIQFIYVFEAGPDTKGPFFSHVPVAFVKASDSEFEVEAIVSDNIAVANVFVDFKFTIGDVTGSLQTLPMNLVIGTDSTFSQTIPYDGLGLSNGDKIEYRIRATDLANTPNSNSTPSGSPGFYNVNVVSLAPTQNSYINDFNDITSSLQDFFGSSEFSVKLESGFSNGAIHTNHPYPEGQGFPDDRFEWVYQLRVPIKVKETEATLKFDEVVLIEPGETGSVFPSEDFYDYVVVDGSKDGGVTWTTIANGYDSRDFSPWLTKYNSSILGNNSTAVGEPSLFRSRMMNLQDKFDTDDEVVIRFRLFSDPGAAGWGWAIDNLKIQIDDSSPTLLHDHIDFLQLSSSTLPLSINVSDGSGVDKLFVEYKVNNGDLVTEELPVTDEISQYTLNITFNGLTASDLIEYRIRTSDKAGNEGTLPTTTFFQVPVITFAAPVAQYIADFNSANTDFAGNFFSVAQPSGFTNGAIHSTHPYPNGFGLTNSTSSYSYTLLKPITISSTNPYMLFDEVALVEYTGNSVKDYVVVEGSKDNGATWQNIVAPYSALAYSTWRTAYDIGNNGNSGLLRSRLINLTSTGQFSAGDNVIFRFRLFADSEKNGWGWAIDNLSIQGPVTGMEPEFKGISLSVYPNPSTNGKLIVEAYGNEAIENAGIQIINAQGRTITNDQISVSQETTTSEYSIGDWADGIYYLRLILNDGTSITRKFIKSAH